MNIGILGSGIVGTTLADGFIRHGNEVMIDNHRSSPFQLNFYIFLLTLLYYHSY